jgi:hypothetical protein
VLLPIALFKGQPLVITDALLKEDIVYRYGSIDAFQKSFLNNYSEQSIAGKANASFYLYNRIVLGAQAYADQRKHMAYKSRKLWLNTSSNYCGPLAYSGVVEIGYGILYDEARTSLWASMLRFFGLGGELELVNVHKFGHNSGMPIASDIKNNSTSLFVSDIESYLQQAKDIKPVLISFKADPDALTSDCTYKQVVREYNHQVRMQYQDFVVY